MENVRVPHTKNGVNYGRWIPSNVYRTLTRAQCLSHACHSLVINVFIQNLIHINKSKTHFGVVQIIRNTLCISDCCDSNRRMWPCDRQLFFLLLLIHRNQSCFQRFFFCVLTSNQMLQQLILPFFIYSIFLSKPSAPAHSNTSEDSIHN